MSIKRKYRVALWLGEEQGVQIRGKEIPKIAPDQVLIKVAFCSVCGTDIHIIRGKFPIPILPFPLGHEISGVVIRKGKNVSGIKEEERVALNPCTYCGSCYYCRSGKENHCQRATCGVGGFGDYVLVKAKQVFQIPSELSLEIGSFLEPVATCMRGVGQGDVFAGSTVVIIGGGKIGQILLQLVQHSGASMIILSDPMKERRELARQFGANITVDPMKEDLEKVVIKATDGLGTDTCIEAVGLAETTEKSVNLVKKGGTVIWFGVSPPGAEVKLKPFNIYAREVTIKGVFAYNYDFPRASNMLAKLNLKPLIGRRFKLDQLKKALEVYGRKEAITVLVEP